MLGLSVGALELDPTVGTNTVLVAGLGRFSSFGGIGGPLAGILRTADGGLTWTQLAADDLAGRNINGVAARGNVIVVSANSGPAGLYRSTDGGANFNLISGTNGLPNATAFDLVGDPSNNARLYLGTSASIFRSDDTGLNWNAITSQVTGIGGTTNNLELAVHNSAGNNVVYAGVVNNGQLNGLWRSPDQGANWTQLDTPQTNEGGVTVGIQPRPKPGGQGATHFAIVADRGNANLVYVGGDRQPANPGPDGILNNGDDTFPNSIGANNFSGRLFKCDGSLAAGAQCAALTHNGTPNNSSPHADSREMVFDANGDIVQTDDGGIYRQTDPSTLNGVWQSLNGNLQVAEHQSCDYDNVGNIVLCGNQDTGAHEQSSAGSVGNVQLSQGDGGFVAVGDVGPGNSVRFSSSNNLSAGSFLRRSCDAANVCVNSAPGFNVVGQGQTLQAFEPNLPLYTPLFINDVNSARLVVGGAINLYESTDQLDNLNIVVTLPGGLTRAVAYGGRQGGADNADVLWYGTGTGQLFLRGGAGGTPAQLPAWTNGAAADLVLDPENWAHAFVTNGGRVFQTTDAGGSFTDITGTLTQEAPGAAISSLEVVPIAGTGEFALLAGTDTGIFVTQTQNLGVWAELGTNLPNAIAFGLTYDPTDDVLLVGTMGRGSWLLSDASEVIPVTDLRVTKTDSPDPVKAGEELFYTVTVTNDGPDDAVGVLVTDQLPAEVIYLSDDGGCTYDALDHELTCLLDDIGSGDNESFKIKTLVRSDAVVNEDDGTLNITNTVTVGSVSVDTNTANNTDTEITFVQELADLKVSKICKPDDELPAGEIGTCTIFVDNLGPSSARDVILRDTNLSDGDFTIGVITPSQGSCDPPVDGVVVCDLGDVAAASATSTGRATVMIELTATEDVDINDIADARSPTPDPNPINNEARDHISVLAVADLSVSKTGPATAVAGTDISYTLAIANAGPSTAQGVVVEDLTSAGVTILSVTGSAGAGCNAGIPGDPSAPTTCSFGTLAPGASRTMTINVHVQPDTLGILHNDARISSETFDDDLADNLDTVATEVSGVADLSITKTDSPDPVLAGEELTYTIVVRNAGPSTAMDTVATDTLPGSTTFVSGVDGNGVGVCALVQPGTVTCDLGDLAPGEHRTVFLTVLVDPAVPDGSTLTDTATVSSATDDPNPGNNTATQGTAVDTTAELWLDKQGVLRSGNPAPVLVYTLVVHNDAGCETDAQSSPTPTCGDGGPSDAQNIVVTDVLPLTSKKVVVQYVSPQCTYTIATHTVRCTAVTLPAGAKVEFVIEVQVSGSVRDITNTATLTSTTDDPVSANNTNSVKVVVKGGTGKQPK
ncbi:MAG TPA: hypothetical protein VIU11_21060 [Nakamurella sp.]